MTVSWKFVLVHNFATRNFFQLLAEISYFQELSLNQIDFWMCFDPLVHDLAIKNPFLLMYPLLNSNLSVNDFICYFYVLIICIYVFVLYVENVSKEVLVMTFDF